MSYVEWCLAQATFYVDLLLSWWSHLSPAQQLGFILLAFASLVAAELCLFVTKNVIVFLLRRFGLSSPVLYSAFPVLLPWRPVLKLSLAFLRWKEVIFRFSKVNTGGFASVLSTMANRYRPKQFLIGVVWLWGAKIFQPVGVSLTKHATVIAGSGAGKSTSMICTVKYWQGSVFLLDPTGIITKTLAPYDKKRRWIVLDPYSENSAQINPFDDIKAAMARDGEDAAVTWAYRIGQSFIPTPSGSKQPYFTDASRGMFVGLVLHVLTAHAKEDHHLGTVRDLIVRGYQVKDESGALDSTPEESREVLYKLMRDNPAFGGAVQGAAAPFINASAETRGNLESTLQERTKVLDIPNVRRFFMRTTLPISALKTRNDVVMALVISVFSLRQELNDVARLIQNLLFYTFESVKQRKGTCLVVADEVQAQGYNQSLEIALPTSRSQGAYVVLMTQDMEGAKAAYPNTYQNFVGGADVVMWMATSHPANLKMLSELLGKKTIIEKDKRTGHKTYREVDVMTPEQVGRFLTPESGNMIVTRAGKRAMRLKIDNYYTALPVWAYAPDPDHKEALLRRITRFLLSPFIRKAKHHSTGEPQ